MLFSVCWLDEHQLPSIAMQNFVPILLRGVTPLCVLSDDPASDEVALVWSLPGTSLRPQF